MAIQVVSSAVKMVSLWKIVLILSRVVEIHAVEPNLHQSLHQTRLHRGVNYGSGKGVNHLYAITSLQEQENSPDVVIGALLDPGASLSFVTPYVASQFELLSQKLCEPFCVSTLVEEPILSKRVYRDYPIYINHKNTMADQVELDMVDFDVILGMDWLNACYASIDYRNQVFKFQIPN